MPDYPALKGRAIRTPGYLRGEAGSGRAEIVNPRKAKKEGGLINREIDGERNRMKRSHDWPKD